MKCPRCKTLYVGMSYDTILTRIFINERQDGTKLVYRKESAGQVCKLCIVEERTKTPIYTKG